MARKAVGRTLFVRVAEPHLTHDQGSGDEDWFQAHSTQVFLIFGSVLFLITLICIYSLLRGTNKPYFPACLRRRHGNRRFQIPSRKDKRKSRNQIHPQDERLSSFLSSSSANGLLPDTGTAYGNVPPHGQGMWGGSHHLPREGSGRRSKKLWRKTAYLTDLKRAQAQQQLAKSGIGINVSGNTDGNGFPPGWERVTPQSLYLSGNQAQAGAYIHLQEPPNAQGWHKRNTTVSSFGHQPPFEYDYGYEGDDRYEYEPWNNRPRPSNDSSSSFIAHGNPRPLSNYIPYNPDPIGAVSDQEVVYPQNIRPPISHHRRSYLSYMSNDPAYLEDLKSTNGARSVRSVQTTNSYSNSRKSYYPRSPASTYVPPRTSFQQYRDSQIQSQRQGQERHPIDRYGHEYEHEHEHENHHQYPPNYHQHDDPQYNQQYSRGMTNQYHPHAHSQPHPQQEEYFNHKQPLQIDDIENIPPSTPYTQPLYTPQTASKKNGDAGDDDDEDRGHERTPSMGSVRFPKPEPSPAPYTLSSTYSFPPKFDQSSPTINFRSSTQTQATIDTSRVFDDHDHLAGAADSSRMTATTSALGSGQHDTVIADDEGEMSDPYSPSKTEVNTKLNSGTIYSPSLYSKASRMSRIPSSPIVVEGEGEGVRPKKRNSGPSLSQSSNDNPSPNFPPPLTSSSLISPKSISPSDSPILKVEMETDTRTKDSDSQDSHTSLSSSSSTIIHKISRVKPPSLLRSTLPPKSPVPKSPSPLRYSSTFEGIEDMPSWMRESSPPLPSAGVKK
ncbi:uncharacterized protein I303_105495 [Kwoniella dejecticola CBS 10117]|uniref:Uncharacterized protein n=1 Tax=Kwoniella dejecticola CBS 10117 TaxID=1296121 RepID=A0A1A6A2B5_9TREE|nr:uncharacterized protein I303_05062 [Kwoniella dejecticola CBS 10117]OBR84205.1 hypothetical protein I303_05062 [Kwoniella dejecticola CBS 10117]